MKTDRSRSVVELVVALAGLGIWFAHFSAVYATQGFGCFALEGPLGADAAALTVRWLLVGLSVVAIAALVVIFIVDYRRAEGGLADGDPDERWNFLHDMGVGVTGLALVGVLWTTLSVVLMEPCAPTFV